MKLPILKDLSEEQFEIYGLPLTGKWTVTGPPGTGKSVMALYRTKMLCDEDRPVTALVHSALLQQYVHAAENELGIPSGHIKTFHSWIWRYWRVEFGESPPVDRDAPGRFKPLNWREIHQILNRGVPPITPDLIVDEGQDLPADFYILCQLLSEHVTVFADQEQTLKEGNASVEDIRELLPSGPEETFLLRRNYRNSRAIAEFASHFYKGLPAGMPDLPDPDNSRAVEPPKRHNKWQDSADEIARWIKNNPEQTVGVFLPGTSWAEKFTEYLKKESTTRRRKNIQPYVRGNKKSAPAVDFTRPGAVVTWYGNAKGLEFDTVFVCELNRSKLPVHDPLTNNLFYVMSSRARSRLEFHYSGEGQPDLLALFPQQSP